ncbi:MAG: ACT domain-containing protein, partial [Halioglobus sp.]|nr:ACT domain-containing protein [Halioglobus sp.]
SLERELATLSASGLSVSVNATDGVPATAERIDLRLSVIGPDRPGIVKEVSRALAERKINVVEMDSHVAPAAMSAENLFNATISASVPAETNLDELSDSLDDIANQMTLDIEIEGV